MVNVGAILLLGAVLALGLGLGTTSNQPMVTLPYNVFLAQVDAGNVLSITLDAQTDDLTGTLRAPVSYAGQRSRQVRGILYPWTPDAAFFQRLAAHGVRVSSPAPESGGTRLLEALLALMGLIGGGLLFAGVRSWRGGTSGVDETSPPPVPRQKRQ